MKAVQEYFPYSHPDLLSKLERYIASDRLGQAFLFLGPLGSGKNQTAEAFITQLFGGVSAVDKVRARTHPDLQWIVPKGRTLKVEDVRGLARNLAFPPLQAPYRVIVIEHVNKMSTAASNAILKILEEPPAYALFILIGAEEIKILSTIRSRCQVLRFTPQPNHVVQEFIERERPGLPGDLLQTAVHWSGGSIRKALGLLDDEDLRNTLMSSVKVLLFGWVDRNFIRQDSWKFLDNLDSIDDCDLILDAWSGLLRDLSCICVSVSNGIELPKQSLFFPQHHSDLLPVAEKIYFAKKISFLVERHSLIDRARMDLQANVNLRLVMLNLFGKLQNWGSPVHV